MSEAAPSASYKQLQALGYRRYSTWNLRMGKMSGCHLLHSKSPSRIWGEVRSLNTVRLHSGGGFA